MRTRCSEAAPIHWISWKFIVISPTPSPLSHSEQAWSLWFYGSPACDALVLAFHFGGLPLLAYSTHGVLDACTSFGTHLLWPFSNERTAWNIVSVLDPLLTLPLLALCITSIRQKRRRPAQLGFTWALFYLFLCFHQHNIAVAEQESLAESRGHIPERAVVKPSFGNNLLFRSVYEHQGIFYIDAIRIGWFSIPHIFTGSGIAKLHVHDVYPELSEPSQQSRSIERFRQLTNDFLVLHPGKQGVLGDVRYALVPGSIRPLWGIQIDPSRPDTEVEFIQMRKPAPGEIELSQDALRPGT